MMLILSLATFALPFYIKTCRGAMIQKEGQKDRKFNRTKQSIFGIDAPVKQLFFHP